MADIFRSQGSGIKMLKQNRKLLPPCCWLCCGCWGSLRRSDVLMRDLGENLNSFIQLIDSRGAASTGGRDGTVGLGIIRRCITYNIGQQWLWIGFQSYIIFKNFLNIHMYCCILKMSFTEELTINSTCFPVSEVQDQNKYKISTFRICDDECRCHLTGFLLQNISQFW